MLALLVLHINFVYPGITTQPQNQVYIISLTFLLKKEKKTARVSVKRELSTPARTLNKWTKISCFEITIFDQKMMVKSGGDFLNFEID